MNDATAKIYTQLTPAELAVLAVKYGVAGNDFELARIRRACPRKAYIMHDATYTDTIECFTRMSHQWGLLYWQLQYDRMQASLKMAITLQKAPDTSEGDEAIEISRFLFTGTEARLLAIDVALDEACKSYGFDASDARKLVGAEIFVPLKSSEAAPDKKTMAEVKAMLKGILDEAS
jgi:hypothetical protein